MLVFFNIKYILFFHVLIAVGTRNSIRMHVAQSHRFPPCPYLSIYPPSLQPDLSLTVCSHSLSLSFPIIRQHSRLAFASCYLHYGRQSKFKAPSFVTLAQNSGRNRVIERSTANGTSPITPPPPILSKRKPVPFAILGRFPCTMNKIKKKNPKTNLH